jgi:phosphate acetyltransferase
MKGIYFLMGEKENSLPQIAQKAVDLLRAKGKKVAYFKPVGHDETSLMSEELAKDLVVRGNKNKLIEDVIVAYRQYEKENDFVVCEGTDGSSRDLVIEFRLNSILADNLCLPAAVAMGPEEEGKEQSFYFVKKMLEQRKIPVLGKASLDEQTLEILLKKAEALQSDKVTPKMFECQLIEKAQANMKKIVLPEGDCERVLKAADEIARRRIATPILLGDKDKIVKMIKEMSLGALRDVQIEDVEKSDKLKDYAHTLYELRKAKGMTEEQAEQTIRDVSYFGTMMVYKGDADGMVSGAEHTTAHTIRPALQFVKTKPNVSLVSGVFLMCFQGKLYVFCDCAVNTNPTLEQLAEIGLSGAQTAKMLGLEPKVAFISYSSGTSGKGPDVDAVVQAVHLAQEKDSSVLSEGPLQFDAAFAPEVAAVKMPNNPVAGKANVFVFPDLNTGNTTYKAVQRAAEDSLAVGPILQGLNKPVNDLSRGATVPDIINTVVITSIFAGC